MKSFLGSTFLSHIYPVLINMCTHIWSIWKKPDHVQKNIEKSPHSPIPPWMQGTNPLFYRCSYAHHTSSALLNFQSDTVPLSLESPSRSSAEHGLSSLPSLQMVRKELGDTDWERLLLLLPLSAPPGVWVSMLRVLLLRCASGGGARCPSGISWGW